MNNQRFCGFDLFSSLLSVFDFGGLLDRDNSVSLSKGLDHDMQQLSNDHTFLAEDLSCKVPFGSEARDASWQ